MEALGCECGSRESDWRVDNWRLAVTGGMRLDLGVLGEGGGGGWRGMEGRRKKS